VRDGRAVMLCCGVRSHYALPLTIGLLTIGLLTIGLLAIGLT
jgi:hypothetical protein